MNLVVWAERNGVARVSAYRWFGAGLLDRTAVYSRVSSADQKADLDRQVVQGRELVVVGSAEVADDLARDLTEILTSMGARLYGKRAAANGAKRAVAAAAGGDCGAA